MNKRQYKKHRFGNIKAVSNKKLYYKRSCKYEYDVWRKRHWVWYYVNKKGVDQLCKFRPEKVKGE